MAGFDDSALAAFSTPALTSVRVDYASRRGGGRPAAGGIAGAPEPAYSPSVPALVVRDSTAARRRR